MCGAATAIQIALMHNESEARRDNMNTSTKTQKKIEVLGLIGIGFMLLTIALFFDPIGQSPESGVLDLGSMGSKWLLGTFGLIFLVGGVWSLIKAKLSVTK